MPGHPGDDGGNEPAPDDLPAGAPGQAGSGGGTGGGTGPGGDVVDRLEALYRRSMGAAPEAGATPGAPPADAPGSDGQPAAGRPMRPLGTPDSAFEVPPPGDPAEAQAIVEEILGRPGVGTGRTYRSDAFEQPRGAKQPARAGGPTPRQVRWNSYEQAAAGLNRRYLIAGVTAFGVVSLSVAGFMVAARAGNTPPGTPANGMVQVAEGPSAVRSGQIIQVGGQIIDFNPALNSPDGPNYREDNVDGVHTEVGLASEAGPHGGTVTRPVARVQLAPSETQTVSVSSIRVALQRDPATTGGRIIAVDNAHGEGVPVPRDGHMSTADEQAISHGGTVIAEGRPIPHGEVPDGGYIDATTTLQAGPPGQPPHVERDAARGVSDATMWPGGPPTPPPLPTATGEQITSEGSWQQGPWAVSINRHEMVGETLPEVGDAVSGPGSESLGELSFAQGLATRMTTTGPETAPVEWVQIRPEHGATIGRPVSVRVAVDGLNDWGHRIIAEADSKGNAVPVPADGVPDRRDIRALRDGGTIVAEGGAVPQSRIGDLSTDTAYPDIRLSNSNETDVVKSELHGDATHWFNNGPAAPNGPSFYSTMGPSAAAPPASGQPQYYGDPAPGAPAQPAAAAMGDAKASGTGRTAAPVRAAARQTAAQLAARITNDYGADPPSGAQPGRPGMTV